MSRSMLFHSLILLSSTFLSSLSQVMLKKASMKTYRDKIHEYLNPLVITAYIVFVGTTFLAILAYRGIPLSLGAVLDATAYIYVTFFGVKIFGEKINRKKIFSLMMIIAGIVIYSASS